MSDPFAQMLENNEFVLADGATGTHLRFLATEDRIELPAAQELLNSERPELVRRHHRAYLNAGSDILLTNSWAANEYALRDAGVIRGPEEIREMNRVAARLLSEEISDVGRPVVCAGSVGPTGWIVAAPDDDSPLHEHELAYGDVVSAFADQISGLLDGGAEVIWIESQISQHEARAAIDACKVASERTGLGAPFVVSMVFNRNERTQAEYDLEHFVKEFGYGDDRPRAIGLNCGYGPDVVLEIVANNHKLWEGAPPLLVKANCGSPRRDGPIYVPSGLTPRQMGHYAQLASESGAKIVGACCGSLPVHIEAMRAALPAR